MARQFSFADHPSSAFPRTPQKPLFGRIGPQQPLGRSRPHSTGRTACSPSFANAGRLLRASTRSPTLGWAFQRSQHCDPKGMRHCGPAQSRCNIVSVPGSPPAAAVPMVLRRVPVPASIYARDFPRLSMVQRRNGAPIPVLRSLKCPTWRWRTSGCAQQSSGVRNRRRACVRLPRRAGVSHVDIFVLQYPRVLIWLSL